MRRLTAVVILATLIGFLPGGPGAPRSAAAATLGVDTFLDTYDGSCSDGDCSLRDAVADAGPGDTVVVPPGFYAITTVEAGGPGDGSIEIGASITIEAPDGGAFLDATSLGAPLFEVDGGVTARVRRLTAFGATTTTAGFAWVRDARLTLDHATISGGHGEIAGAVVVDAAGTLTVRASLFTRNHGTEGAGGIENHGVTSVRDSTFLRNHGRKGGGILNASDGRLDLLNVTIANNRVRSVGGGLYLRGYTSLLNVTIAGNRAARGGAVAPAEPNGAASLTIVAGNIARGRSDGCLGPLRSTGGNVEDGDRCGFDRPTDRVGTDPLLGPATANGGPTPTVALRPGSPALDRGGDCPHRDQRGAPRDGRCDAGAYERVLCLGRPVNIVGTPGSEELSGGREPDTFLGLGGDDEFQGSLADDRACGGRGDDHLIGGPGSDILAGGGGADRIDGEQGGDVLRGGRGADELHGGPGRDTCRASSVDRTTSCEVRRGAQRTMLRRSRGQ